MMKRTRRPGRHDKAEHKKQRTWPVGWTSLMLLLQSLGMGALAYHDYLAIPPQFPWPPSDMHQVTELIEIFFSTTLYAMLALVMLFTALAFFRLARRAWLMALGIQGVVLSIALVLYTHSRPPYLYLLMVFSIYIVIYLHYYEVQLPFQYEDQPEGGV